MKFLITLCLIASLATIAWTGSASWGRRNYNDILLYRESFVRRPQYGHAWKEVIYYPKNGQGNNRNISAVFAIDQFANNSGAFATLWAGGPGHRFVKLGLQGQVGKGMNTTVEIYGR